jgi:uncharacterized membrane protein YfcA
MISLDVLFILCPLVFLASLIDSIAGGGGLVSLTAYTACGLPPTLALGNNKFSSTCGTVLTTVRYAKHGDIDWSVGVLASIMGLIGAALGSHLALVLDGVYLKYMLLVLVPAIAFLTLKKKDFGESKECRHKRLVTVLTGLSIGCYDGFFGPGTGMFLTWIFSVVIGLELLKAVGTTKLVNLSSNIAALVTFAIGGNIDYRIGIPCAICSVIGGYVGSSLAMKKGTKIVRPMLLVVLALLMVKVIIDIF